MGWLDKVKGLTGKHADKVTQAIDKVADVVDDKTHGKYGEQIDKGAAAAKGFVGDGDPAAAGDPSGDAGPGPVPADPPPADPPAVAAQADPAPADPPPAPPPAP